MEIIWELNLLNVDESCLQKVWEHKGEQTKILVAILFTKREKMVFTYRMNQQIIWIMDGRKIVSRYLKGNISICFTN